MVRLTAELVQRHARPGRRGKAMEGGEGVTEVVVPDADVDDASRMCEFAPSARVVSLPFNALKGDGRFLVPVAATLEYVDLSHNQLGSLRALAEAACGFPRLRVLRLGGNRFRDVLALTAVADLGSLEELWLQGNRLESVGQLCASLRGATGLRRLAVAENPFRDAASARAYRTALAAALPWLDNVDGARVTDEERSGVVSEEADTSRASGAASPLASVSASAARGGARRRGVWEVLDGRGNKVVQKDSGRGITRRGEENSGASSRGPAAVQPWRGDRAGLGRVPVRQEAGGGGRPGGGGSSASAAERSERSLPPIPRASGGGARGTRVPGVIRGAAPRQKRVQDPERVAAKKALEEEMRRRIFGDTAASSAEAASTSEEAVSSMVVPADPLTTLPFEIPPGQAEVSAAARERARAEARKRQEERERLKRANALVQQAADGVQSLQLRYPRRAREGEGEVVVRGAPGPMAVLVRPDGSAQAKWPNGALAVSVDPETAATTCKASFGGRGGSTASSDAALMGVQQPKGTMYRVYASHRGSGGIAVSMDARGRHCTVNYPSGQVCLSVSPETGGVMIAEDGALLASWDPEDLVAHVREGAEACGDDDSTVGGVLSEHMAFTFRLPREPGAKGAAGAGELQLYFACSGVRYRFCSRGGNQRAAQWAPAQKQSRAPLGALDANNGASAGAGPCAGNAPAFCDRLAEENALVGWGREGDGEESTDVGDDAEGGGGGAAAFVPAFSSVGGENLAPRLGDISSIISGLDSFFSKA